MAESATRATGSKRWLNAASSSLFKAAVSRATAQAPDADQRKPRSSPAFAERCSTASCQCASTADLETVRHMGVRANRRAPCEAKDKIEQSVSVHRMKTGIVVSILPSIFFIFARARKARTLIAARLQPVSKWISCTEHSSRWSSVTSKRSSGES